MADNIYAPYGFFEEDKNIAQSKRELPTVLTGSKHNYLVSQRRTVINTAGLTVPTTGVIDLEVQNPLIEAQAVSHYAHTSQSYIEAAGSVANAYIVEQVNSYSITDQNEDVATIKQPSITSYVNGMVIQAFISTQNTNTSTIALRYTTTSATNPIVYSQATLSPIQIYKRLDLSNTYIPLESGDLLGAVSLQYLSTVPGIGTPGFIVLQSNAFRFGYTNFFNIKPYSTISADLVSGQASFIVKINDTTISFSFGVPIKVCFPDGKIQTYSSSVDLPNITGITTNGTYTIIKEFGTLQPIATTSTITESYTAPAAPVNGDYWLDISRPNFIPYKRVGGAWVVTQFVKLGQFVRTGGVIGTPVSYALNRATITLGANFTGAGNYTQIHSLGYNGTNVKANAYAVCTTANNGFLPGDAIILTHSENINATIGYATTPAYSKTSVCITISQNMNLTNPTGTSVNIITGGGINNFRIVFVLSTTF